MTDKDPFNITTRYVPSSNIERDNLKSGAVEFVVCLAIGDSN